MGNQIQASAKSRKFQAPAKSLPGGQHSLGNREHSDGGGRNAVGCPLAENDGFFDSVTKVAGLTTKDIQFYLRVSDTLAKLWKNGERIDPLLRARHVVDMFRQENRADLIPSILIFIAGGFDGAVLTAQQFEALKVLQTVGK